jgi:hypothetical protein
VQRDGRWWVGWPEEIPGVSSQGASREELMENLRSALSEALEMNRSDARQAAGGLGAADGDFEAHLNMRIRYIMLNYIGMRLDRTA